MSAGNVPEFVIVSDDQSCDSTVHAAVTDKSGIQKLLTLSEVSSMQKELPTEPASKKSRKKGLKAEKIPCGVCSKTFVSEKSVERHRKTVHSNKVDEIDPVTGLRKVKGGKSAVTQKPSIVVKDEATAACLARELDRLKSKEVKRPRWKCLTGHSCQACGKTFTTPSNLQRHLVVHTGEKPFPCPFCPLRFSQLEGLKRHQGRHTGENIWTCSVCRKWFVEKSRYTDHMMAHLKELPYNCKVCQKGFANRVGLQKHEKLHLGLKQHVCEICQKSFSEKQRLNIHYRIHTGHFPHKCKLCGQGFNRQKFLVAHMERHDKYGILKCPKCSSVFSSKACFTRHQKNNCSSPQPPQQPPQKPAVTQRSLPDQEQPVSFDNNRVSKLILPTAPSTSDDPPVRDTQTPVAILMPLSPCNLQEHCYASNAEVPVAQSSSPFYNFHTSLISDRSTTDSESLTQTVEVVQEGFSSTAVSNKPQPLEEITDHIESQIQDQLVSQLTSRDNQSLVQSRDNASGLQLMTSARKEVQQTVCVSDSSGSEISVHVPRDFFHPTDINIISSRSAQPRMDSSEHIPEALRSQMADVLETLSALPQTSQGEDICVIFEVEEV